MWRLLIPLLLAGCTYVNIEGDGNTASPYIDTDSAMGGVSGSAIDLDTEVEKENDDDE